MKIYHPTHGSKDIPAIDFTDLWRRQGWQPEPLSTAANDSPPQLIEPSPREPELFDASRSDVLDIPPTPESATADAISVINAATEIDELTPLPGIGKGAAKLILAERPEGGYESLSTLPSKIFEHPYNVSLEGVVGWSP